MDVAVRVEIVVSCDNLEDVVVEAKLVHELDPLDVVRVVNAVEESNVVDETGVVNVVNVDVDNVVIVVILLDVVGEVGAPHQIDWMHTKQARSYVACAKPTA